jgi:hypothetical protein
VIETRMVETEPAMVFDVSTNGTDDAPLVLMLHGFGASRFFWNAQAHAVGEAGYFAVAPNQRGYAAGARPDPTDHASYRIDRLIFDALDIVAAIGYGDRRFTPLAMTGEPALLGRSQISTQSGSRRSPSCPDHTHWPLRGRWKCRMASSGDGLLTIGHSWSLTPARTSWHTTRTGCGRA